MADPIQDEDYSSRSPQGFLTFSMRDFIYVLFRHKWKITIFFLLTMIAVTLAALIFTETYRSEAKLMIRIGRESVTLDPTVTTGQVISVGPLRDSEINSEIEILKNRELAKKVIDEVGAELILDRSPGGYSRGNLGPLEEKLREFKKLVKKKKRDIDEFLIKKGLLKPLGADQEAMIEFTNNFAVERQKDTSILVLSYQAPDAQASQKILSTLIDFFLEKHIVAHRIMGSYEFFGKQSDQIKSQVANAEEELRKLKSRSGVASLEDQRRLVMTRIGSLQQEREATQSSLAISQARVRELKGNLAGMSPTLVTQEIRGTNNQAADLMRARLYELQLKEQELISKYTPTSMPVKEVRRQIEEANALLAKEEPTRTQVTTGINTAYQELSLDLIKENANLSSLEAKVNVITNQLNAARAELNELSNTEVKMVNLQRELSLLDAKYRKYTENLEQARIDQALMNNKISNISVVQSATVLPLPIKPPKLLFFALGLFLGIFGGISLAFFSEYHDHSLKKPQDVEGKLSLPLLASVPVLKK